MTTRAKEYARWGTRIPSVASREASERSEAATASRYIDVAFAVTKYGRGKRIEILDTSSGATRGDERNLVHLIESTSFRPRAVDGALADSAPVTLRYHLDP